MHTSSEFFSLFLSCAKGVCPNTLGLYSSPRLLEGKSRSWCSKHFKSGTPDLFSFPGCSPSRKEMNSVSLFSFSNHSLLSSSSSPICSDEQQFSSSVSNRSEPDASSVIKTPSNLKTNLSKMIYRPSVCIQALPFKPSF